MFCSGMRDFVLAIFGHVVTFVCPKICPKIHLHLEQLTSSWLCTLEHVGLTWLKMATHMQQQRPTMRRHVQEMLSSCEPEKLKDDWARGQAARHRKKSANDECQ